MPTTTELPPGPHRDLIETLHQLYIAANRPGIRAISNGIDGDDSLPTTIHYQAVGKILNGKTFPTSHQVQALGLWLFKNSNPDHATAKNLQTLSRKLSRLWQDADTLRTPETPHSSTSGGVDSIQDLPETIHSDNSAERRLLAEIIASRDAAADVIGIVEGRDFSSREHALIFESVVEHAYSAQASLGDLASRLIEPGNWLDLIGGEKFLRDLVSGARGFGTAEHYAEIVHRLAIARRLAAAGRKIQDLAKEVAESTSTDVAAFIDAAEAELHAATGSLNPESEAGSRDAIADALDMMDASSRESSAVRVPSGFAQLDAVIAGGFRVGYMVVIAATPMMGKSSLALNFIRSTSIQHALPSAFFLAELSGAEAISRMLAAETSFPVSRAFSGEMSDTDWVEIANRMPEISAAPFHVIGGPGLRMSEIRRRCRTLKRMHDIRLAVVDDAHKIEVQDPNYPEKLAKDPGEVARQLSSLARELEIAVIATVDLGRISERWPMVPVLNDLNPKVEEAADSIILLHREDLVDRTSRRLREADLDVVKNRFGSLDQITLAFQGEYSRFVDFDASDRRSEFWSRPF